MPLAEPTRSDLGESGKSANHSFVYMKYIVGGSTNQLKRVLNGISSAWIFLEVHEIAEFLSVRTFAEKGHF
jgi:hypothetical protein